MTNILKETQSLVLVSNQPLKKAEAIICLEGDGYNRIPKTFELFQKKWAKWIVVSGGLNKPPFSIPAKKMKLSLVKKGIPASRIILEEKSQNTYMQATEVMKMAKKRKWKKIILVASSFHQPRAYLTFIKAMNNEKMKVQIINAPADNLPWFKKTSLGKNRFNLLVEEFKKIKKYYKKGHSVSFEQAIAYEKWKEGQK